MRVGDLGEQVLGKWAAEADAQYHPPKRDRHGWDGLLEILLPEGNSPLDRAPSLVKTFVQVKSSDKRPGKWSIKLSNLKKMVDDLTPAFFLFLEFDEQVDPVHVYLVHVDKSLMTRVLRRVRKADSQGNFDIHKLSLSVKYNAEHRLEEPTSRALFERILSIIGDPQAYQSWKSELFKSLGYEKQSGQSKVTVELPEEYRNASPNQVLVDMALGRPIKKLIVQSGDYTDIRFDIPTSRSELIPAGSTLEMHKEPFDECTLELTSEDETLQVRWDGQLYSTASINHLIRPEECALRVVTPFLDIIVDSGGLGNVNLNIHSEEVYSIRDLSRLERTLRLLLESSAITSRVVLKTNPGAAFFGSVPQGHFVHKDDQQLSRVATWLQDALTVANASGPPADASGSIGDFGRAAPAFKLIADLIHGERVWGRVSVPSVDLQGKAKAAITTPTELQFGKDLVVALPLIVGHVKSLGSNAEEGMVSIEGVLSTVSLLRWMPKEDYNTELANRLQKSVLDRVDDDVEKIVVLPDGDVRTK